MPCGAVGLEASSGWASLSAGSRAGASSEVQGGSGARGSLHSCQMGRWRLGLSCARVGEALVGAQIVESCGARPGAPGEFEVWGRATQKSQAQHVK